MHRWVLAVNFLLLGFFPSSLGRQVGQSESRLRRSDRIFFAAEQEKLDNCTTNEAEAGECLELEQCFSRLQPIRSIDISTLQGSKCSQIWKVCCPLVTQINTTAAATTAATFPDSKECGLPSITNTRVVGGDVAPEGAWPWLAMFIYRNSENVTFPACSGSLINERFVLTAAHCLKQIKDIKLYKIRLGEHHYGSTESARVIQDFDPLDIIIHPDYKSFRAGNDIGLVKLDRKAIMTNRVATICLPVNLDLADNDTYVAGWGRVSEGGKGSDVLMQARVPIVPISTCRKAYHNYTTANFDATICAGGDGKTDSCRGDSGGPLMWSDLRGRFYGIGIVSWGHGCANEGYPGIYTKVHSFLDWIDRTVNDKS